MMIGKPRKMFRYRYLFLAGGSGVFVLQFVNGSITSEGKFFYYPQYFILGLIFLAVAIIAGVSFFLHRKKLILHDTFIQIENLHSQTEVFYDEIQSIEFHKVFDTSKFETAKDGYSESILVLKNGDEFRISSNEFENYAALMAEIRMRLPAN